MNAMVDVLVRRRELFAVVLLAVVAAQIVLGLIGFVVDAWPGSEPVATFAATLAAILCAVGTPTRHVRALLVLSIVGVVVATLVEVGHAVAFLMQTRSSPPAVVVADVVLTQAPSLIAAVAAAVVCGRWSPRTAGAWSPTVLPAAAAPVVPAPPPLVQRPTWDVDQASGAAWSTAGDAARGAPGTGWDSGPGSGSGSAWDPIPRQPAVPPPQARPRWEPGGPEAP